jgi:type I restriction enzyme S subunit
VGFEHPWPVLPLRTLAKEMCLGKMLDKQKNKGSLQPYLRNVNVRWFGFDLSDLKEMRFEEDEEERFGLKPGDLVICEGGEPGRAAVWNGQNESAKIQKALHRVRFNEDQYDPQFAAFFLYFGTITHRFADVYTGTTIKHLTGKALSRVDFPIAPLSEQRAIVAKIEALFSELDHGVEQLEAVRAQLKRYRQAVLKAAFEGKLTADWRAEQQKQGNLPTADELLAQIKQERAERYEQQLAEWKQAVKDWEAAGGKDSGEKKPRKPAQLKELPPVTDGDLSELPDLPSQWVWDRLGTFSSITGGVAKGRKLKDRKTIDLPYLRVANVQDGYLDLDVIKTIALPVDELDKYLLFPGDVLYIEGGDKDKLGRGTVWRGEIDKCIHQNHVFRARPVDSINSVFLAYYSQTETARCYFFKHAKQTVNLASINMTLLSYLPVPLPPVEEQQRVVEEIEARISVLDQLEKAIDTAMAQAQALRQSILKKAFEGRLLGKAELNAVRSDPAYEPAVQLLKRIQLEREKDKATKPSRSRKNKPISSTRQIKLPKGERYRQAAHAAYAVKRLSQRPTFGRVQLMKFLYLAPHLIEQESHIHAERKAAGPLDPAIHKVESLARNSGWFTVRKSGKRYVYSRGQKIDEACAVAVRNFGDRKAKVDWLLEQFVRFDTERAELLATTFAVWNDHLIDGHEPSEKEIVEGVHGWHPDKAAKFDAARIGRCIQWIRENDMVPTGIGPKTQIVGDEA